MTNTVFRSTSIIFIGLTSVLFVGCFPQTSSLDSASKPVAESAETANQQLLRALDLQRAGDNENAIAAYSDLIILDPSNPIPYNNRGHVQATLNRHDEAIEDYTQAIQRYPRYADALYNRGTSWYSKGNVDNAISDYTLSIEVNSKSPNAFAGRGNAKFHIGDFDGAIADFNEAIELKLVDARTYYYRGSAWLEKDHLDNAIKDFSTAISLDSGYANAFKRRGLALHRQRKYDLAIADFSASISLDPHDDPMVYFRRAWAWSRKLEFHKAILDYEFSYKLNPNEAITIDRLAWMLATCPVEKLRDGPRAVELAAKACELTGWTNEIPINTLAAAYAEVGNFDEAIKFQLQAIKTLGDTSSREFNQRLELYRSRTPFRQSILGESARIQPDSEADY